MLDCNIAFRRNAIKMIVLAALFVSGLALADGDKFRSPLEQDVQEAIAVSAVARVAISEIFKRSGKLPKNRTETGMSDNPSDTSYRSVRALDVVDGTVIVTFGESAEPDLVGRSITLVPSVLEDASLKWSCNAAVPRVSGSVFAPVAIPLPDWCRTQ